MPNHLLNIATSIPPKRIVSLVPSQTELLFTLGLKDEVVGITKFCIHPQKWFKTKQRVGGTKTINIEAIKALQPDLVIANKEENVKEQIETLQQFMPVWVSDINTLDDAVEMITTVGGLVQKQESANKLVLEIKHAFAQLQPLQPEMNAAYLIWKDPYMAAGGETFISDLMKRCGFKNVFQHISRYPEILISDNKLSSVISQPPSLMNCQLLLLSSEPYPFKQKHLQELQLLLPHCRIILVNGEMFSWYGSRLLLAPDYFQTLTNQIQG